MVVKVVATVSVGNRRVQVVSVPGMKGYRFDAVGKESLPLAAELAVVQTQRGISYLEERIGIR